MKMTDKADKGSAGRGGGGGGGGGSGGGGLHWLLPNIAEAIEILDGATVQEVQNKIEELTSMRYSKSELTLGLENGAQLGLFEVEREFSLNAQYLNSELKSEKFDHNELVSFVRKKLKQKAESADIENLSGGEKVKGKRIRKRPTLAEGNRGMRTRQKMCDRCRKISPAAGNTSEESPRSRRDSIFGSGYRPTENMRKSKLLVERNPLENEPPSSMFT